jgi:REP element-mobilizing transposase RayT
MIKRKPNMLRDYDYSLEGYYCVTICTKNRKEWFGKIENGEMCFSTFGKVAKDFWAEIPLHFHHIRIDEFSIMPNHVHGILIIEEGLVGNLVGNTYMRSHKRNAFMHSLQDKTKMLLSKIIQQYKSSVTRKIGSMQNDFKFEWQKSFYDHVIRNEKSLHNLRHYITFNSLKWELDIENKKGLNACYIHKSCKGNYNEIIDGSRERFQTVPYSNP